MVPRQKLWVVEGDVGVTCAVGVGFTDVAGFGWWRLTGRHGQFCLGPADRGQALRLRGLTATHMAESFA